MRRPEVIALDEQYGGQGLRVVGITFEPRKLVENYVAGVEGMDWPIAYGAQMLIELMGVQGFPTYTIYDRAGKSVFSDHTLRGAEDAIVAALAK